MDSNAKSVTAIDLIDTLVNSLASSFTIQLELNHDGYGPINLLPSEMMQQIMAKLGLDDDLHKLVPLRLVSTSWRAIIEDYCRMKKSLVVNHLKSSFKFDFKSAHLILKSVHFFGTMLKLFPNVEKLAICGFRGFIVNAQFGEFASSINSLGSLRQLKLEGHEFVPALAFLSKTLSKLEYIKVDSQNIRSKNEQFRQVICHLGPDCVRVNLQKTIVNSAQVLEWQNINPHWLSNLTHLDIHLRGEYLNPQVVHSLCEHATLLKHLDLSIIGQINPLVMVPSLFQDLGTLAHLIELILNNILLPLSQLEKASAEHSLTSLASVLNCKLSLFLVRPCSADRFTRVFSVILPSVVEFSLAIECRGLDESAFKHEFEQHFDRFPNLRKHTIYKL